MEGVGISGIEFGYPEHKYSTAEMFDILGPKLSDGVRQNVQQLGVENRYFVRPMESYLGNGRADRRDGEPISDLSAEVAKRCLANLGLDPSDITCLVAASENSDYLSPGLSAVLVRRIGLSNFVPHFNLQGMACSTFPKVLELGKSLARKESDKVLVVISGCNSGWYLPHLGDGTAVVNPKEMGDLPDREKRIKKWVSTMFSFLFGDGVVAFVLSGGAPIRVGRGEHAVNFDQQDYLKACVRLRPNLPDKSYEYELTAGSRVIDLALDYSKKVVGKFLGGEFDEGRSREYMGGMDKVMIHTGSMKILDGFKRVYSLRDGQLRESYETLRDYGNLTGCSIPTVMRKAFVENGGARRGVLVGITMGFGLDVVEVEKD